METPPSEELARTLDAAFASVMAPEKPHGLVSTAPHRERLLEPLASAKIVLCRTGLRDAFEGLPHIVDLVSEFLDSALPNLWSIERACEKKFGVRMLTRLAAREATTDPFQRKFCAAHALETAARTGDLEVVCWLCREYCPSVVPLTAMREAAACGQLRVLQWLFDAYPGVHPNTYVADAAIENGHIEVLQWLTPLLEIPTDALGRMMTFAAARGQLEIVQWLHAQQESGTTEAFMYSRFNRLALANAVVHGHFAPAKFLADRGYPFSENQRMRVHHSVKSGDLDMIQWLHARGLTRDSIDWINEAAAAGHLPILKWAHENMRDDVCSVEAMNAAARIGRLDIIQWLHVNRSEGCTVDAMNSAAFMGHFEIVQWLHTNRTEGCSTRAMDFAAANGHVAVVQWLHANRSEGCTVLAMDRAADAGRLGVVQWLHEHRVEGCSTSAMDSAAASGHLDVVQWLHEHRREGCTPSAMNMAARNGHLDVVQWLHEHRSEGCTTFAMDMAARSGHLAVVQWLHTNRDEGCTTYAMDFAQSLPVLAWLHERRLEGYTTVAVEDAVRFANFDKLLFLKANGMGERTPRAVDAAIGGAHLEVLQWMRANGWEFMNGIITERTLSPYAADRGIWAMFHHFELHNRTSGLIPEQ